MNNKSFLDVSEQTGRLLGNVRSLVRVVNSDFGEVASKTNEADELWQILDVAFTLLLEAEQNNRLIINTLAKAPAETKQQLKIILKGVIDEQ